jgi:hypothetical protein
MIPPSCNKRRWALDPFVTDSTPHRCPSIICSFQIALVPADFFGRLRLADSHRARCCAVRGRNFPGVIVRANQSNASKSFSRVRVLFGLISSHPMGVERRFNPGLSSSVADIGNTPQG